MPASGRRATCFRCRQRPRWHITLALLGCWAAWPVVAAETPPPECPPAENPPAQQPPAAAAEPTSPNVPSTTLGGLQYWGDELVHGGWRIQRHVTTGHCRLLDPADVRRAWGTFDVCHDEFARLRQQLSLPDMDGKVVLLLHGLGRTRYSMQHLADYLQREGGYTPLLVGYPSTRAATADHARALARVVRQLDTAEELHLVGYSFGNLVIRHWLGDVAAAEDDTALPPTLGRIVMVGPPNHGAQRAMQWSEQSLPRELFRMVTGEAGLALGENWDRTAERLATPSCPFGIVAGGKGDDAGFSAQLSGDDDGVVRVEETRLHGARDFVLLPLPHAHLLEDERTFQYTLSFLRDGHFRGPDRRQAIE